MPATRDVQPHHHAMYKCLCGRVMGQCKCTTTDKEVIVLDDCSHYSDDKRKKKPITTIEQEQSISGKGKKSKKV